MATAGLAVGIDDERYLAACAAGLPPLGEGVRRTVIITGAPRSGTSLVAGLLHRGGLHLGSDLLTAAEPHAARGLCEDGKVIKLNDVLLAGASGSWTLPPPPANFRMTALNPAVEALVRYEQRELWGLKDPSFCLTLPLWEAVLDEVEPRVVACHRNPRSVALSLLRWLPSLVHGLWLAAEHERRLAHFLGVRTDWPTLHVSYEALLANPLPQAAALARFAGVEISEEAVAEFVDPSLRHH